MCLLCSSSLAKLAPTLGSNSMPTDKTSSEFASVEDEWQCNNADTSTTSVTAMVVGLPNCGKSTLINALRSFSQRGRQKAVPVGKMAGRTRSVGGPVVIAHNFPVLSRDGDFCGRVLRECTIRMVDTPGILEPKAQTLCGQLSLAVCGAVDWNAVDKGVLAISFLIVACEVICLWLLYCWLVG